MDPIEFAMQRLRERWWLALLTVAAALVVALALSLLAPEQYRSTARYLIAPIALADVGDLVDSTAALDEPTLSGTYAELFNSPNLQRQAALAAGVGDLDGYTFSTVVLPQTVVLQLTVTGPDPEQAARLANGLGDAVMAYLAPLASVYDLELLDSASPADEPYSPQLLNNLAVALVLGVVGGVVLVLGVSYLAALAGLPERPVATGNDAG
jgi:capsular polysaccharide biosynthesis protein